MWFDLEKATGNTENVSYWMVSFPGLALLLRAGELGDGKDTSIPAYSLEISDFLTIP